jgi:3-deoxy-D-manno-octulosonate 8-phosphate phosphatase (KDO 8-P phosphatase)
VSIESKAARIKLVLFDVDGVLTDGRVLVHADGTESKNFCIRDGIAMVWAQRAGIRIGFLSARYSATTAHRAQQLGVALVHQGVSSKLAAYLQITADLNLRDADIAYMGDDIVDLAVLSRVGLATAPADAVAEVRSRVHWVSSSAGGNGAARELLEAILRAQDLWDKVVRGYVNEPAASREASPDERALADHP